MSIVNPNDSRVYVQATLPWAAAIPNSTGSATVANGDAIRHIKCDLQAPRNIVAQRARTGSLGNLTGQGGRRMANFELEVPLQGSGTAGTAADMDPIWAAIVGQAGTVVSSTSITYAPADAAGGLTIWKFKDPAGSNIWNEVIGGAVVDSWEVQAGDEAEASLMLRGPGVYVVNKPKFASLDTGAKMGLTAFPSEPSSPAYLGLPALAFVGSVTINSVGTFKLQSARIFGNMGRSLRASFGSYYSTVLLQGRRTYGCDFTVYEEDTSAMADLRHLAYSNATCDASFVLGDVAGNIHTFNLNRIVIGTVQEQDGDLESTISFSGNNAAMSGVAANDEFSYVAT